MRDYDLPLAVCVFVIAVLAGSGLALTDWFDVWTYDVKPWLFWDGKPAPPAVGHDLRVIEITSPSLPHPTPACSFLDE